MDAWIVLSMIAVYFAGTTVVGSLMVRRSRRGDDWAIAGRHLGPVLLTVGIAATRVGGVATYGVAGDVINGGIWNLWYAVSAFVALAITGRFFAIPYRRLGLRTVGEIFVLRFGSRRCQALTSLCVQTEFFIVNIIEPYIIARMLSAITGWPFGVAAAVAAVLLISYTTLGGLWASAVTNAIHSVAIFGGLLVVAIAGQWHLGGWSAVVHKTNAALAGAGVDPAAWWSPAGAGWLAVVGMFFAAAIHTPAASIWVNFAAAARDEKVVVPAFAAGGFVAMAMSLLAGWIGIETLAMYGAAAQLSNHQTITRLATDLSPWIGGLALAAILAAVLSSGGPILLSSATMLVRDWLPSERWSETRRLGSYRIATIGLGVVGAAIAALGPIPSILNLLLFAFAMVVPPAIAVAHVLFWKRTTETAAFWGMALGYSGSLLWYLAGHRLNLPVGVDPSYPATFIPLVTIPMLSRLTPDDAVRREAFFRKLREPAIM